MVNKQETSLASVELCLVPDRVDDSQESFEGKRDDAVRRWYKHPPQWHLNKTHDRRTTKQQLLWNIT